MKKLVLASIITLAASSALMADVNTTTCKACHGQQWQNKALGKSKIVAKMSHDEIAAALKRFKTDASYNGPMKLQVANYSVADLEEVAKTIPKK